MKPSPVSVFYDLTDIKVFRNLIENNLTLQQRLYELRSETKEAFDEAKQLEARWKELEKEQKEVYQVR
jgi:hypothetical protein